MEALKVEEGVRPIAEEDVGQTNFTPGSSTDDICTLMCRSMFESGTRIAIGSMATFWTDWFRFWGGGLFADIRAQQYRGPQWKKE